MHIAAGRFLPQRHGDHLCHLLVGDRSGPTRPRLIRKPAQPATEEPRPPLGSRCPGNFQIAGHRGDRGAAIAGQHDSRPHRQRGLAPQRPPLQDLSLLVGQPQWLKPRTHHTASLLRVTRVLTQCTRIILALICRLPGASVNRGRTLRNGFPLTLDFAQLRRFIVGLRRRRHEGTSGSDARCRDSHSAQRRLQPWPRRDWGIGLERQRVNPAADRRRSQLLFECSPTLAGSTR